MFTYLRESWQEIRKVDWPKRQDAIRMTIAVIVFSLLLAVFLGAIDAGLTQVVKRFIVK